ncbi:hypothetical protein AMTR_s00294p00011260 [Amborella trichopoda]|uniref:Uncharacterized protein n=1 Tax=Amborella trichopoda TaxID=13333 RepID=W1PQI9_AMBTC|nr:hypothetical protein AMTR_s00294p00011260 [Amborella trichopoda]
MLRKHKSHDVGTPPHGELCFRSTNHTPRETHPWRAMLRKRKSHAMGRQFCPITWPAERQFCPPMESYPSEGQITRHGNPTPWSAMLRKRCENPTPWSSKASRESHPMECGQITSRGNPTPWSAIKSHAAVKSHTA